ncbi:serine hydrolase [Phenylobacterium sp.]|uniref:serine hydrolase domain-containing protein n=1 Tax=Phenylobacterium sp. TaxID=1871053 RepID=UPI0027335AF8|nr:serine hydrolase domain-containing protein [Phenylobacterium sp.]MDP3853215.1 serine hydrolase domain-containing protein [Phenylobacterium sp.]
MHRRSVLAGALAAFGSGAFDPALARISPVPSFAKATLDAIVANTTSAGGFVAAARGGRMIAFYDWGSASLPFQQPVTPQTLFHIASCGKQFTALAVQQLAEAGRIKLDDRLGDHLKSLPASWAAVRLSQLLHQTSGLPDYLEILGEWDRPQGRAKVIDRMGGEPVLFQPGASWSYSNTNYLVLGWLIEEVSGIGYADYLDRFLFKPAGLPRARADAGGTPILGRAEPYEFEGGAFRHAPRMETGVSQAADGGVLFSASDLAPWRAAVDGGKLISAAGKIAAESRAPLTTGRFAPYGFGHFLDRVHGKEVLHHSGGAPGFVSFWITFPDSGLSVLAATNTWAKTLPPLRIMALTLAESLAPETTYLSLWMASGGDSRTARLRTYLQRGDGAADAGLFAPELAAHGGLNLPKLDNIEDMAPVESYSVSGGEMVRYRVLRKPYASHLLAGWTTDERLFWLG